MGVLPACMAVVPFMTCRGQKRASGFREPRLQTFVRYQVGTGKRTQVL